MIIARSVRAVKEDLKSLITPDDVMELCRSEGHVWRVRKLDPVTTIFLLVQQILHGNTSCTHVRQLGEFAFTASAYCQARMRLPVNMLLKLMRFVGDRVASVVNQHDCWRGHRLLGIDGSSFSMSDSPGLKGLFGCPPQQREGCGFPIARFVALFCLRSGTLLDLIPATTKIAELPLCRLLHRRLRRGDVLVGDRAYCSYAHLALLARRGIHGVFRLHAGRKHGTVVEQRSRADHIVEWCRPRACPPWLSASQYSRLPERLRVRLVQYRVNRKGFRSKDVVVATTLTSESYPAEEIAELYGERWQVEVNLRHIKNTMRMDVLRCQTVDGVYRELATFAIVYNAVCLVIAAAAEQQKVRPDRISFVDVLRWITAGCPGDSLPRFTVNPDRVRPPHPRVVKRRHKNYTYMTQPRHGGPGARRSNRESAI